jgi:hypothetical protein
MVGAFEICSSIDLIRLVDPFSDTYPDIIRRLLAVVVKLSC